jgi:hypothetical protein
MPLAPNGRIIPHTKEEQLAKARKRNRNVRKLLMKYPNDEELQEIVEEIDNSQLNLSPRPERGKRVNPNNLHFRFYPKSSNRRGNNLNTTLNRRGNNLNTTSRKRSRSLNFGMNRHIHALSKTRKNWKNAGKWAFYRKFSNTYKNTAPTGIVGTRTDPNDATYNYAGHAFKGKPTLFSKNYNSVPWKEEIPEGAEGMYEEYGKKPIAVKYLEKREPFNVFEKV